MSSALFCKTPIKRKNANNSMQNIYFQSKMRRKLSLGSFSKRSFLRKSRRLRTFMTFPPAAILSDFCDGVRRGGRKQGDARGKVPRHVFCPRSACRVPLHIQEFFFARFFRGAVEKAVFVGECVVGFKPQNHLVRVDVRQDKTDLRTLGVLGDGCRGIFPR